jgi:hypothetical protein
VGVALVILLSVLVVLVLLVVVARLYPGGVEELMGLDPQELAEQRAAAEAEDLRQLLELERRHRAGS